MDEAKKETKRKEVPVSVVESTSVKLLLPKRRAIRTSTVLPTRYCVSRETELLDRPDVSRNIEACARWMFKKYSGRGSSTHLSGCLFPGEKNAGNFPSRDFQRENAAVPGRRLDRYKTKENEPSYRYATVKWVSLRFVFLFDKILILSCVFFCLVLCLFLFRSSIGDLIEPNLTSRSVSAFNNRTKKKSTFI